MGFAAGAAAGFLYLAFDPDLCNDASYQRALDLASNAVVLGQQAPLSEPEDALAQWQRADSLWEISLDYLGEVRSCSDFYEPAQERLESYEANRAVVQNEIANLTVDAAGN